MLYVCSTALLLNDSFVVSHITSVVIQNDVHDASQAQCDSELDFL